MALSLSASTSRCATTRTICSARSHASLPVRTFHTAGPASLSPVLSSPSISSRRIPQHHEQPARGVVCRGLFGLGLPELAVIAGVAALIFGPSKLPELGKGLGKTVKSFQTAAKEFETELKAAAAEDDAPAKKDAEPAKKD